MDDDIIGIFMGLSSSSNEYIARLIAPYKQDFDLSIGSLLRIQGIDGDLVARVIDYQPHGELTSAMGTKWLSDIAAQGDVGSIGSDIKKNKIRYEVKIKVLGSFKDNEFSPGLKKIPHITSKVSIPGFEETKTIIQQAMSGETDGIKIGTYDLLPNIDVSFAQHDLNSKRTFIFARAGYGKSNLMKIMCSEWNQKNGGLLVFDADGEYATTDKKGRPGVMDKREAILFTNQKMNPDLKNVYHSVKLNLAQLPHELIIPLIVNPDKHEMVFFAKLMAMRSENWPQLVRLVNESGWGADQETMRELILGDNTTMTSDEARPILNNLVKPIRNLHDNDSDIIPIITKALKDGYVVIFDISRTDPQTAREVSSIIVRYIFNENRKNFIQHGGENLIRTTFVLEEAHTVLSGGTRAPSAFVELAKEGRKYGLGGIFITQQPGSIPIEIVSQGDNFFVFHLLSKTDLTSLSKSNAHYSDDVVTQILSEPIPGKSYVWTSRQPFVIPTRVRNFEDAKYTKPNQSNDVQQRNLLLDKIQKDIVAEQNDPVLDSIRKKYEKTEAEHPGAEIKEKTIPLYKKLSEEERSKLEKRGFLQPNNDGHGFFAVKIRYYRKLQEGSV